MNIFRYDQNEVRTHEDDGQAWFCLNDVAKVLGIAQPKHFLSSEWCDKDGVRSTDLTDSLGRDQQTTFINEGNLYTLVGRSRKPSALAFTRWVNHEVLPALRKTGRYEVGTDSPSDPILATLRLIGDMRREQLALESRVAAIEERQDAAREAALALPAPSAEVRELTTREHLRQAVETYVVLTGIGFREAWNRLYRSYDYQKATNLTVRSTNAKMSKLDWLEKHGDIETAYAIASRMVDEARRAA